MIKKTTAALLVGVACLACSEGTTGPEPVDAPRAGAATTFTGGLCIFQDADDNFVFGTVSSLSTNGNAGIIHAICEADTPLPNTTGNTIHLRDRSCQWIEADGAVRSDPEASVTIRQDGGAAARCTFRTPPPTAFVEGDDGSYEAREGTITVPLAGSEVSGDLVDIGPACTADLPLPDLTGKIALILRRNCPTVTENLFTTKITNAQNAGAIAAIVYNDIPGGGLLTMGGEAVGIPGVFVTNASGLALQSSSSATIGDCAETGNSLTCQGNLSGN